MKQDLAGIGERVSCTRRRLRDEVVAEVERKVRIVPQLNRADLRHAMYNTAAPSLVSISISAGGADSKRPCCGGFAYGALSISTSDERVCAPPAEIWIGCGPADRFEGRAIRTK